MVNNGECQNSNHLNRLNLVLSKLMKIHEPDVCQALSPHDSQFTQQTEGGSYINLMKTITKYVCKQADNNQLIISPTLFSQLTSFLVEYSLLQLPIDL